MLTDLRAYAEWNPLNVAAEGVAVLGSNVDMKFIDPGRPGRILKQTVQVTVADAPWKLEWLGRIPFLFSGRHFFRLRSRDDCTEMTHGEMLSGLVPAFWGKDRWELQRLAYEKMNLALGERLAQLFGPTEAS